MAHIITASIIRQPDLDDLNGQGADSPACIVSFQHAEGLEIVAPGMGFGS
jgi:hypothetical protein